MSIKNYLITLAPYVILIFSILLITFIAIFIKVKNKKLLSEERNLFKKIKKIKKKNNLRYKSCYLHILQGDLTNCIQVKNLSKELKLETLSSNLSFAIGDNYFLLFISDKYISEFNKIRQKNGFRLSNINFHYDINKYAEYNKEVFDKSKNLGMFDKKDFIINFFTEEESQADIFNKMIGKNNLVKLNDVNQFKDLITYNVSNIIESKNVISYKYICMKLFMNINYVLDEIFTNLNKDHSIYLFLSLNKCSNHINTSNQHNYINNIYSNLFPIIFNISLFSISGILLWNIVQEILIRNKIDIKTYSQNYSYQTMRSHSQILESYIDSNILFSSLYPKSIKYRRIYVAYANYLILNILLENFKKKRQISDITAFLIYFMYVKRKEIDYSTNDIVSIVAKLTDITEVELTQAIIYADSKTRKDIIEIAGSFVKDSSFITTEWPVNSNIASFESFDKKYLSISDSSRVNAIYQGLKAGINKCITQNLLSSLMQKEDIPKNFEHVFKRYKEVAAKTSNICNSKSIETIASSLETIEKYSLNLQKINDFQAYLNNLYLIIIALEQNQDKFKINGAAYKKFRSFLPVLIQYAINSATYAVFNNNDLPLKEEYSFNMYMKFKPVFYNKEISISPLYSTDSIDKMIVPLNTKFKQLYTDLTSQYGINMSFVDQLYQESLNSYIKSYKDNFKRLIEQLNSQTLDINKISNDKSLMFYLIAMNSTESQFNNILEYYKNNINIEAIEFKEIVEYFKEDYKYLSSDGISKYRQIFINLKNLIINNGYGLTYNIIAAGYEPLNKVYTDLAEINMNQNNNLYKLLKNQLDTALKAIERIAIDNAISKIDKTVEADYIYINNLLPFNIYGDKAASNHDLVYYIGSSGKIYLSFNEILKPLLKYNETTNLWYNDSFDSKDKKTFLNQFNKVYASNALLWNKDKTPKSLQFYVKPIPSEGYNYTFTSLLIGQEFINSLNIDYNSSIPISYNWSSKDSVSIILKLGNGDIVQKIFSGDWGIIKAIREAKYENNIYTWMLEYEGKQYPVSFEITADFLKILKA